VGAQECQAALPFCQFRRGERAVEFLRDRVAGHNGDRIHQYENLELWNALQDVLLLEVIVKRLRLHLGRIEDELREVQRHFPAINAVLNCRRDDFTDTVRRNMLAAYEFLAAVVDDDLDLFSDEGLEALLQLNHLVLLGKGYGPRAFSGHITLTRRRFFDNFRRYVKPIRVWYRKHETENAYKVASQVYVGVLSQPQLYHLIYALRNGPGESGSAVDHLVTPETLG